MCLLLLLQARTCPPFLYARIMLANVTASGAQPCSAMRSNMSRAFTYSPPCAHAAIIELKMVTSCTQPCADQARLCALHLLQLPLASASTFRCKLAYPMPNHLDLRAAYARQTPARVPTR